MLVERIFLTLLPVPLLLLLLLLKVSTEQELLAATRDACMSSEVKDALGCCSIVNWSEGSSGERFSAMIECCIV